MPDIKLATVASPAEAQHGHGAIKLERSLIHEDSLWVIVNGSDSMGDGRVVRLDRVGLATLRDAIDVFLNGAVASDSERIDAAFRRIEALEERMAEVMLANS